VVTYHRTYSYFLRRFGLRQFATLEPRPGIPPSARHIAGLLQNMKGAKVRALLIESIYPARYPNLVARGLNTSAVRAPYSVASTRPGAYAAMMDRLVEAARQALAA
jgi:ABC-type Zn uptake system ZnuABC Zn-binding protein ZnuA